MRRFATLLGILYFFFLSSTSAVVVSNPKGLVLPVSKDGKTKQYVLNIYQRTPRVSVKTSLHLGGKYFWVNCQRGYISSTYQPVRCGSAGCKIAGSFSCITECYSPPKPGCNNNTCGVIIDNPVIRTSTSGELGQDVVSIPSTDGYNSGPEVSISNVSVGCGGTSVLNGLPQGVQGIAGFGRAEASLPYQVASSLRLAQKFAICLTSAVNSNGMIVFGGGPYKLPFDISGTLVYTPLIRNPVSTAGSFFKGEASTDYFIKVTSIQVGGKAVMLNNSLLTIDRHGRGGTKMSTLVPYTVLQTTIYRALINAYSEALSSIPRVAAVAPFELCINSSNIRSTKLGPAVPGMDFVLHTQQTIWTFNAASSMVQAAPDVLCLGVVDGGMNPTTSIVIGGYQMEEQLLEFDLAAARFGFSPLLYTLRTSCPSFNFTST